MAGGDGDLRSLLDVLPETTRREVRATARRRRFRRGEVLFHEGDPGDSLHVVVRGHVAIRTVTPLGDAVTFTVMGPGDHFGELALLDDASRRTASAVAIEGAETLSLPAADVARLRAEHPEVERLLVAMLARSVGRLSTLLTEALYTSAEVRVLRRLVELADSYAPTGVGPSTVPLTQDELAGLAGTTRPTVNRALRSAEADGLVALGRGRVEVLDRAGLAARAR